MSNDVLVKVDNVSKRFCRSLKRSLWYGLQDLSSEIGGRRHGGGSGLPQSSADVQLRPDEFWAVKDVSFELRRGECLGLIGRNGAGKTTLLRMLNGLIKPDTGRIEMQGRVGALIALGAGFNPLLTGRENIRINGSVLGLSRQETEQKIDEIVEFAGLSEFVDSPVQSYSSGMSVRLGFAIASTLKPDILLIDEVLAVGDAEFRMRCFNRIYDLSDNSAIIIVSHSMPQILRVSNMIMEMRKGRSTGATSDISQAMSLYFAVNEQVEKESLIFANARINKLEVNDHDALRNKKIPISIKYHETLSIRFEVEVSSLYKKFAIHLGIVDGEANTIAQCFSRASNVIYRNSDSVVTGMVLIDDLPLANGRYTINVNIINDRPGMVSGEYIAHFRRIALFEVSGYPYSLQTPIQFKGHWSQENASCSK